MRKRVLSLFLVLCMLVTLVPASVFAEGETSADVVASGTCGDNLTWTLDSEGALTISGTGEMYDYTISGTRWNDNESTIKSVVINPGVTSIGDCAFMQCYNLTSIDIPDSVTSIGNSAFYCCYSLASVAIPDSVTSIGDDSFIDCTSLTSIDVSEDNENFTSIDGVLFNKDKTTLLQYPASKTGDNYTIPDGITSIGYGAFWSCKNLTKIVIPNGVTIIESWTFGYCSSLTSITIPDSVTSIGRYAYWNCDSLADVYYCGTEAQWNEITIGTNNECLTNATRHYHNYVDGVCTICGDNEVTIVASGTCGDDLTWVLYSDGILTISGTGEMTSSPWRDNYRDQIKTVVIEDGVTSICSYAFQSCSNLTSITIPDSVTSIGEYALSGCGNLTSITIPDSVTSIGEYAFWNCSSLTSITIPYSVTSIGYKAFYMCDNLTSIDVSEDNENYASIDGVLYNKDKIVLIQYPIGKTETEYVIPEGVTSIEKGAFEECYILTSVTFPDSLTSIGDDAFWNCYRLTSVTIPDSVTSIGEHAFYGCSNLTSVTIPDSATSIGYSAFRDCYRLTSVAIPDGVLSIEEYAFSGCNALTCIIIPDSVTSIGEYAFSECSSIADVYYCGTEEQWNAITIDTNNDYLTNATRHYHNYVDGVCTICGAEDPDYFAAKIVVSNESASTGDEVVITVSTENNPGVMALTLGLDYDETRLEFVGFENAGLTGWRVESKAAVWLGAEDNDYNGAILKLKFKVLDTAPGGFAEVSLTCSEGDACNSDAEFVNFQIESGGVEVHAHDYTAVVTAPTCIEQGYTTYVCECGDSYVADYVEALGHNYVSGVCTVCGEADPNYHEYTEVVTAPTCTEQGYTTHTCTICGDSYVDSYVAALGHNYVDGVCTICGNREADIVDSGSCGDDLTWVLYSDGILIISGTGEMTSSPWKDNYSAQIKTVIIEDGVTSIGDSAFYECRNLTSVTIGDSVTSIGDYAFFYCSSLTSVTIPDRVTNIGESAFEYCNSLVSVTIPDSVTSIGATAFECCDSLTSVTIPDSVTSIGVYAFCGCNALASITIPDSVTKIGEGAFDECSSLTSINVSEDNEYYTSIDGVLFNKDKTELIKYPAGKTATEYVIPDGVTSIVDWAFFLCTNLTSVTIPDSITTIGWQAFLDCNSLTSITIPDSVTNIGYGAFSGCSSLADVYYCGTEEQWNAITIDEDNDWLTDATRHYHNYVDGVCTICGAEDPDYVSPLDAGKIVVSKENASTGDEVVITVSTENNPGVVALTLGLVYDNTKLQLVGFENAGLTGWKVNTSAVWMGYADNGYNGVILKLKFKVLETAPGGFAEVSLTCNEGDACNSNEEVVNFQIESGGVEVHAHDYTAVVTAPTCTEQGYTTYTCECGKSYVADYVEALGHDCVHHDGKAPTCTEPGWEAYDTCSRCDYTTYKAIPATGHTYGTPVFTWDGYTCKATFACKDCGDEQVFDCEVTSAVTKAASCTETGVRTYTASVEFEGKTYTADKAEILEKLQHTAGEAVRENEIITGCTEPGSYDEVVYCTECGVELSRTNKTVDVLGHDYGEWTITTAATCTTSGVETRYCCRCDAYETREVKALGHDLVHHEGKAATCTESGCEAYDTCTRCDYTTYNEIPATGHNYTAAVTSPTCTEKGYTTYTCHCGDSYVADYVEALGHDYGEWIVTTEPTCTESGVETHYCSRCDAYETREAKELGHDLVHHDGKAPTCTVPGWEAYDTCTRCDYTTYNEIPATGHHYTAAVTAPTCTEKGYTTYTCDCGRSYVDDYVKATGHNYEDGVCTECGTEDPNYVPPLYAGTIVVSNGRARAGEEVTVTVSIEENPGIMVMILDLDYDESKLELIGHEDGLMTNWVISEKAVWIGGDNMTEDGVILTLKFKVLEDVEDGEIGVSVLYSEGDIANHDERAIMPGEMSGIVTVYSVKPGDINGDDKINALDLVRLQRYLAGEDVVVTEACDVTGDGKINALDLVRLQRYLAGEAVVIY